MAIIKVEPGKPLTLTLANPNAEEVNGRWGIQFKYRLENRDLIYLPPIAHEEIQKLHAGPGEPFTLLKSIGQGNQAVWKVERIVQEGDPITVQKPGHPATTGQSLRESYNVAQKSITNGNGVKSKPVEMIPTAGVSTAQSRTLLRQLVAAIEACIAAKAYANSVGVALDFDGHDVRALAISGSIQVFKEGVY